MTLYPEISIYGFVFLSNHTHILISSMDGAKMASFIGYIKMNITRRIGRLHGWTGSLWKKGYKPIPIVDEGAQIDRLRYLLSHGVKEGLVARPEHWPGASSLPWFLGGSLFGKWMDRSRKRQHSDKPYGTHQIVEVVEYPIPITSLPVWRHLAKKQIANHVAALIDHIVETHRGRTVLGVKKILNLNPHDSPKIAPSRPAPLCHATSRRARDTFHAAYKIFVGAFRAAATAVKNGVELVRAGFPPGSFARAGRFMPVPPNHALPWMHTQPIPFSGPSYAPIITLNSELSVSSGLRHEPL